MSPRTADLAIIGAGASGTHLLLALLRGLSAAPPTERQARIVVLDRDPQFFSGVAYGNRSGPASLTLSTLHGFLPDEERARFVAWLTSRPDVLHGADVDPAWSTRHRTDIAAGRWDELFIPRRLYGRYLAECADAAIRDARSTGVADVALVTADVTSIDRSNGRLLLAGAGGGGVVQIDAAAVVLATGSPPVRRLDADDTPPDGLIRDVYDPDLDTTLARLRRRLGDLPLDGREVLVVGGNAAALEFVSAGGGIVRELGARVTVLTPSGRPRHWRRGTDGERAELVALQTLRSTAARDARVTARQLYDAVAADLDAAVASGTDVAAVREIVKFIPDFLPLLDAEGRAALAERHGIPMSTLLRQDCGDALDLLESMVDSGAVVFRTGRYRDHRVEGGYFLVTASNGSGDADVHDTRYGAVVGAIGFEAVSTTRAPLIRHVLRSGLVAPSGSDAGLRVDSRFRAAPGLFVVGPLLAGNAHRNMLIWHAESVRRIMSIAPEAASCIARELGLPVANTSPWTSSAN